MTDIIPFHEIRTKGNSNLNCRLYNQYQLASLLDEPAHRHDMHEIILVTKGKAEHTVDMDRYWLSRGSLCLIAKGQVHNYHHFDNFEIWAMFFLEDMLPKHLHGLILSLFSLQTQHHFHLESANVGRLELFLKEINSLLYEDIDSYAKAELLQSHLSSILLTIERIRHRTYVAEQGQRLEYYRVTQGFLALLEQHAKHKHSVNFYSNLLQVSPRKLTEVTQETLGKRSKQIIEEHLNLEARRMLRFTDLTAQDIAYDLGFDDPSYFTRFFKKHNQQSPSKFREQGQIIVK